MYILTNNCKPRKVLFVYKQESSKNHFYVKFHALWFLLDFFYLAQPRLNKLNTLIYLFSHHPGWENYAFHFSFWKTCTENSIIYSEFWLKGVFDWANIGVCRSIVHAKILSAVPVLQGCKNIYYKLNPNKQNSLHFALATTNVK